MLAAIVLLSADLPAEDRWLAQDKWKHASASCMLTIQGEYYWQQLAGAELKGASITMPVLVLSLGTGKEVWDMRRGSKFSYKDIVADFLGIAAGVFTIQLITED